MIADLHMIIRLIGKDGDDVIDNITCELTGTESINTHTEYTYLCGENVSYIFNIQCTLKSKLN